MHHRQESASRNALDVSFSRGEADLREVYDAHGPLVYAICRRTLGDLSAAEVTQDVFVKAWKARDQYDPKRGALAAWLVGITKRCIIDHVRRERRHSDRRVDDAGDPPVFGEAEVEQVADQMTVAHALAALADRPRKVISLAYVHGFTHQEIADQTGLPLGTIKSDIRRGLLTLRDQLAAAHG